MSESTHCPGCRGSRQILLESIALEQQHRHYAPADDATCQRLTVEAKKSAVSYQMLRCSDCGLEFAWPMRSPPASWYALAYQVLDLYPQARWEFQTCLGAFRPDDTVFEFGCGSGAFMELCRKRGIKTVGVDFSLSAVEDCRKKGLDVFPFEISASLPNTVRDNATQIVAFHVLEHLEQPRLLFERAAHVARRGAHLWIAVPSHLRLTRQRGILDFLDQPPHHMTRWSRSALEQIGAGMGWQLVRLRGEPMQLKTALWSIATSSPRYRRWREAGRLKTPRIERTLRFASYPAAIIRRITVDRALTGFSMLACYTLA